MKQKGQKGIDVLAIVAHPDDAELGAGGLLILAKQAGLSTGIIDLTAGEMGTRGTPEQRRKEATRAAQLLQLDYREIGELPDSRFRIDDSTITYVIRYIRRFQPKLLITNALRDRHPDHGRAAQLVKEAAFYSGLQKWVTYWEDEPQAPWRPLIVLHMIQDYYQEPSIVVDITSVMEEKMKVLQCFESQFYNPNYPSDEPETPISTESFWAFLYARARELGRRIQAKYGEGFITTTPLPLFHFASFFHMIQRPESS